MSVWIIQDGQGNFAAGYGSVAPIVYTSEQLIVGGTVLQPDD